MAAQFSYFTTSDDLREIVKQVDANTQFQYIEYKNFSESEYPNARMYDSLLEYPPILATHDRRNVEEICFGVESHTGVVPQKSFLLMKAVELLYLRN